LPSPRQLRLIDSSNYPLSHARAFAKNRVTLDAISPRDLMTRIDEKEKEKREREGGGERARRSMESSVLSRFVDPLASRSPIDKSRRGSMRDRRAMDYGEGGREVSRERRWMIPRVSGGGNYRR